jgi:hypothetical protein
MAHHLEYDGASRGLMRSRFERFRLVKAGCGQLIVVSNPELTVCSDVYRGRWMVGIAEPTVKHKELIYQDPLLTTAIDELPLLCKYNK